MCDGSDPFHIVSLNAQKPRGDVGKRCGGNGHGGCEPERSPDDLVRQGTRTGRTPGASPPWLPVDGVEAIPQKAQRGGDEDRLIGRESRQIGDPGAAGAEAEENQRQNAAGRRSNRSDKSRVGKECVSKCRYRWSPAHKKKQK